MRIRYLFAISLIASSLAVGFFCFAPAADAAPAGPSVLKPGASAKNYVIEIKRRGRGPRAYPPPIAPAYIYYDYPYYYSRGHYPTHIGPGFIYFGYPYKPRYGGRCSDWERKCVAKLSYRESASVHRQRGACRCQ
jgi:hypothetical protein